MTRRAPHESEDEAQSEEIASEVARCVARHCRELPNAIRIQSEIRNRNDDRGKRERSDVLTGSINTEVPKKEGGSHDAE